MTTKNDKNRAVALVRVSTSGQEENGFGLDAQKRAVTEYAENNGIELVELFEEVGSGYRPLEERDVLGDLQNFILEPKNKINLVIVPSLDRIAREVGAQETFLNKLERNNIKIVSVKEPDLDDSSPERVMWRQMMAMYAQYERKLIAARMRAGRIERAKKGLRAAGSAPYGFKMISDQQGNRHMVKVPEEVEIVKIVFQMRDEGYTFDQIAEYLNVNGFKPRTHTPVNPKKFTRPVVYSIYNNPIYKGVVQYKVKDPKTKEIEVIESYNEDYRII